jgi:hypothetical protein
MSCRRFMGSPLLAVILAGSLSLPAAADQIPPPDPLSSMVDRIDQYLQANEVGGVTMDWRYEISPSEEIRQTVVCQVLAYAELYRLNAEPRVYQDIVEHADFLLGRLEDIRSHSPFDGMLAYSLLAAYETTGEARFLDAGREITLELIAIPTSQCKLNGGLMVAMATAQYWMLTGDSSAEQKTHDILAGLVPYQNVDGSFPHWCPGSRDIHYTGWMAMELIHVQRLVDDVRIAPLLDQMTAFLEARIDADGMAIYEEPCPGVPNCTLYYYSRMTGCSYDHDTRGWTVEPAYCVLLFDHMQSDRFGPVLGFLETLEDGGTFSDLYDYWPPPEDPEYPWTIADTSVVNMSVIFWALSTVLADRGQAAGVEEQFAGGRLLIEPNPAVSSCVLRFALAEAAEVSLTVFDARGRRVRILEPGMRPAGPNSVLWDGRDQAGSTVPTGLYFGRLDSGSRELLGRFVLMR